MVRHVMVFLIIAILTMGCEQLSESNNEKEVFEIQPSIFPTQSYSSDLRSQTPTLSAEPENNIEPKTELKNPGCSNLPDDVVCTCTNGSWHNCYSLNDSETQKSPKILKQTSPDAQITTSTSTNTVNSTLNTNNLKPTLSLEPSISHANTFVKAIGSGFPPNSSVLITYHYGSSSNNRATFTTNNNGDFSNQFPVPSDVTAGGENLVRASSNPSNSSGNSTQISSSATHFVPSNELSVSSEVIIPGNKITITGQSFSPYTSIKYLQLGNLNILNNPVPTTDSNGTFTTDITVPNLSSGLHLLVAIVGNKTSSTYAYITGASSYTPLLTVEPELSYPGSQVTVTGTNYPINTSVLITYSYGLASLNLANTITDSSGNFNASITIPTDTTVQTNNLIQTTSNANLGNNVFETITAGARHYVPLSLINISKSEVLPGDILTLTGSGFTNNDLIESITIGSSAIITMTSNSIDNQGKFSTEFVIPRLSPGIYLLTVTTPSMNSSKFIEIIN